MKVYDYDKNTQSGARRIRRLGLRGYQRIVSIDPTRSHFKFAPQLVKIDLNPHRTILPGEHRALSLHPTVDMVIVMPVGGPDLRNRVLNMGNQSVSERILLAQKVLEDVLPELAFAAKNGLVLGDIGPKNILLNFEGKWGFNDFDSVVHSGEFNTLATPYYLAPELMNGKQSEWITDIYSLGLTVLGAFFSSTEIRDIIGFSESKLPFGPSSNPDRVFEKLDRMFQQLENPSPEAVVAFKNVRAFLHASLETDPIIRRSEFLNLDMASGFRFEDSNFRKSEIDQLISILESKILPNDTSDRIAKKILGFSNLDHLLGQLVKSDHVYPQAFRVAKALNINIENESDILISKLRSRLPDENQAAILDSYLGAFGTVDKKLGSVLVKKFVLSGMYNLTTIENIFSILKTNPDLVQKFNEQLVQRLQSTIPPDEKLKIAMLYLQDPNHSQ